MDPKLLELMQKRSGYVDQMTAITSAALEKGEESLSKEDAAKIEDLRVKERSVKVLIDAHQDGLNLRSAIALPAGTAQHAQAQPKQQIADQVQNRANPRVDVVSNGKEDLPFASFGEQLRAVANAAHGQIDERLSLVTRAASGHNEGVSSEGGFAVQKDFIAELLKLGYEKSIIASDCRKTPISGNSNGLRLLGIDETSRANGSRMGGIRGYWAGETDAVTASKVKLRAMEINLGKIMLISYASDELLEDAAALASIISEAATDELAWMLDDAVINGDGSQNKPVGILNAACLVSVAKETSQTAATFNFQNALKMRSRLHPSCRKNAKFYINLDVEPQLPQFTVAGGTSSPGIYLPAGGASEKGYDRLFGYEVRPIEQAKTLGTKGDVILADFSQFRLIDKGGVKSDVSMHVRFLNGEQTFRFTYRVGGQSLWHSAVTPANGSNTLSPFVVLDTRA